MFGEIVRDSRLVKQRANFKARDCCYKCLLPQKICQPNSEGRDCLDKDLLGVFLVQVARKPSTIQSILPEASGLVEAINDIDSVQIAMRMMEVDKELLGTETPKVVLLFLSFCTRFKDQSEAKE